jgi:hypothetical protein
MGQNTGKGKVEPEVPQGYFVIALLAGGTICQANRTAAKSKDVSRHFLKSQPLKCTESKTLEYHY